MFLILTACEGVWVFGLTKSFIGVNSESSSIELLATTMLFAMAVGNTPKITPKFPKLHDEDSDFEEEDELDAASDYEEKEEE